MQTQNVVFWSIVAIVILCLLYTIVNDNQNRTENMDSGSPSSSAVQAQQDAKHRARNQLLYSKCEMIFGGDMKFLNSCKTTHDNFLTYEKGIERAFEIYHQNKRDGYSWGNNIYLAIVQGNMKNVICQTVYRDDPRMQALCLNSTHDRQKEAWIDYWKRRRESSMDWRLMPATLTL